MTRTPARDRAAESPQDVWNGDAEYHETWTPGLGRGCC